MTCKDFIEFLSDYVSGELPNTQKALFEEHLRVCGSCIAYLSNYRETLSLTKAAFCDPEGPVPEEVPEDLVTAVLSARKAGGR
jgi:predicted anti-sigma-YlaC factor YlaD